MATFELSAKNNSSYLDIAANAQGDEKSHLLQNVLPRLKDRPIEIIEIGPGGGASIRALTESLETTSYCDNTTIHLKLLEVDGIESSSLKKTVEKFQEFGQCEVINGLAQQLDDHFDRDSAHVISASSVLHEVYSYGGGYSALYKTIGGVTRTLKDGGYFAYRDIFSVESNSLHDRTIHSYTSQSWIRFIKLFSPYYFSRAQHPYHGFDDGVFMRQNSAFVEPEKLDCSQDVIIESPVGALREIQRHYITLRDHVWRAGVLGFRPVLDGPLSDEWIDKRTGHKRVLYELTNKGGLSDAQIILLESMSEESGDKLAVDGDIFDEVTDTALNHFMYRVESGDQSAISTWNEWLNREGGETYTYMTTGQLIGAFALKSIKQSDHPDSILLPAVPEDVILAPRNYYNRFLHKRLSNPLFDGKQLILFKKVELKNTSDINQGLHIAKLLCPKDMLSNIYGAINEGVQV